MTTVWVGVRDGRILVTSALGRKKSRKPGRNPRVALAWTNPNTPSESAAIRGRVAGSEGGEAERDVDRLAKVYLGADAYPSRQPGERRIPS